MQKEESARRSGPSWTAWLRLLAAILLLASLAVVWKVCGPRQLLSFVQTFGGIVGIGVLALLWFLLRVWAPYVIDGLSSGRRVLQSILHLLGTRIALEPVCAGLRKLPKEGRAQYANSLARISDAWVNVLMESADLEESKILLSLFEVYAREEACDIGGVSIRGKHFVVTNFVAYSKLVRAIIRASLECYPGEKIKCFTTLAMPLTKWFNFRERNGHFCEYDRGWDAYISELRELLREFEDRLSLSRCILVAEDGWSPGHDHSLPFLHRKKMQESANARILVPLTEHRVAWESIEAMPRVERDERQLGSDLEEIYDCRHNAYVICPHHIEPPTVRGAYDWIPLREVFTEMFHSSPQGENSRYYELTSREIKDYFQRESQGMNMPEDLFMVGLENRWLCCLAGDVDQEINYVSLEFISSGVSEHRFEKVKRYVEHIKTKSTPLSDLG